MENFLVEIGGFAFPIRLPGRGFRLEENYLPFLVDRDGDGTPGWLVRREEIPGDLESPAPVIPPFPRWEVERRGEEKIFRVRKQADSPRLWKAARLVPDLSRGVIWNARTDEENIFPLRELDQLLFAHFLLSRRGLIIHGAAGELGGKGYIFPAPAGGGKSTWAELMKVIPDWTVLGEDKIILRITDGQIRIFGTPWNPRRGFRRNASAPLKGIFFLEHSPGNYLRRLRKAEVIAGLLRQAFLPFPAAADLDGAVALLEDVVRRIPAFNFGFRPDNGALDYFRGAIGEKAKNERGGRRR